MKITIRPALKADCNSMMQLINELALFEKAPQEVTVSMEHFEDAGFGPRPVWWAFVAVVKRPDETEEIVGFALYYIRYSTWKGSRIYLEDILVTENMRGKGIGKLLMDKLIQVAREKQFTGITWQVLDWNSAAIDFYKKYNARFDAEWVNCSIEL